jgi:hypothetical protein
MKPFPDSPYITGLAYMGVLLNYYPYTFTIEEEKNLERGFYKRWDWNIPGYIVRDWRMDGEPHQRMLNRDQWLFILYPLLQVESIRDDVLVAYQAWRDYAVFKPRHWLAPNHSSYFDRCLGGSGSGLGDYFEYWNVRLSDRKPNRTVSSSARFIWTMMVHGETEYIRKAWKELQNKTNVLEDWEEYFTRAIPGDEPGEHPRVDLIWKPVLEEFKNV